MPAPGDIEVIEVSIHAPRAGRDPMRLTVVPADACFNPRAPRGARLEAIAKATGMFPFQSTRPARGATSANS